MLPPGAVIGAGGVRGSVERARRRSRAIGASQERSGARLARFPRLLGCFFGGAILVAPFLALLIDLNAGLVVMGCGLTATASLAFEAARSVDADQRKRLRVAASVNGLLAVACLTLLAARLW